MEFELESFKGPLELLLDLLEKNKIDIEDIRISEITDQYLKEMEKIPISAENISGFIEIAASLLYIKSQSLLEIEEEEDDEEGSRERLVERLKIYKKFRRISEILKEIERGANRPYERRQEDLNIYRKEVKDEIIYDKNILKKNMDYIFNMDDEEEIKSALADRVMERDPYSVSQGLVKIMKELDDSSLKSLRSCMSSKRSKRELISLFLSVLELLKAKKIDVVQFDRKDLFIKRRTSEEDRSDN